MGPRQAAAELVGVERGLGGGVETWEENKGEYKSMPRRRRPCRRPRLASIGLHAILSLSGRVFV